MPFLDGERLLLALQIWEEKYSNEPIFGLTRFVNELCDSTALQVQRGKVLQALIQTLTNLSSSSPVRASQLNAELPVKVAQSSRVPQQDATWTCMLLVDTLMRGLSPEKKRRGPPLYAEQSRNLAPTRGGSNSPTRLAQPATEHYFRIDRGIRADPYRQSRLCCSV